MDINNIFAIGYKCATDEFIKLFLKIRKYSSPFSYMVIDINTALDFIKNGFENYTSNDYIKPGSYNYKFNNRNWGCKYIHNCSVLTNEYVDILDMDKVCLWNHHDLYDKNVVSALNKRADHLLHCINNKSDTTLLFYIEKIQEYGMKDNYFDKSILDGYNCNFLILIPLLNFNRDPVVFFDNSQIRIIYFNSNIEGWTTDTDRDIEEWDKLAMLVNTLYNFNIENRDCENLNIL
jgi:hypothetical protein